MELKNNKEENKVHLRGYLFIWAGQSISSFGSSTVSFIIIWWITITTGSPFMLALSGFIGVGSTLVTQPIAGVFADRKRRKLIIFLTDLGQALATVWIMVLFMLGQLEIIHIMLLLLVRGLFQGFQTPAANAIIPSMVPKDQLARMNSFNFLANAMINLVSPAIAAILLAVVGLENFDLLLAIDAITFIFALIPLIFVDIPEIFKKGEKPKTTFKEDFTEGLSFLKHTPGMLPLLLTYAMINFFLTPTFILLPYMVAAPFIYNSDEALLASVFVVFQFGAISVSLLLSKRNPRDKLMTGVTAGILIAMCGVTLVGYSGVIHSTRLLYVAMFSMGIGIPFASVYSNTIWQKFVPSELQGRVMSVRLTLSSLVSPFSILMVGFMSETINPSYLFLGFGATAIILYIVSFFMTKMRYIESGLYTPATQENLTDHLVMPN